MLFAHKASKPSHATFEIISILINLPFKKSAFFLNKINVAVGKVALRGFPGIRGEHLELRVQ